MAYDLEELGNYGFQDLAASLTVAVFGPTVQVMGAGRDGGRDMYIDGPLTWTDPNDLRTEDTPDGGDHLAVTPGGADALRDHVLPEVYRTTEYPTDPAPST